MQKRQSGTPGEMDSISAAKRRSIAAVALMRTHRRRFKQPSSLNTE
jgi:hypothetical protein